MSSVQWMATLGNQEQELKGVASFIIEVSHKVKDYVPAFVADFPEGVSIILGRDLLNRLHENMTESLQLIKIWWHCWIFFSNHPRLPSVCVSICLDVEPRPLYLCSFKSISWDDIVVESGLTYHNRRVKQLKCIAKDASSCDLECSLSLI